jgi:hypothetical protein
MHLCVLSATQKHGWNLFDILAGDVRLTGKMLRYAQSAGNLGTCQSYWA